MTKRRVAKRLEVCFSSPFFLMTTGLKQSSNVAIASLSIDSDRGAILVEDALIDTGGSKNLASRHLLKDIRLAESYGNEPIRMVTVNGLSPDYNHQGELHTTDENGNPLVILCYVQEQPIMGHDTFILVSNNTIVDCDIDINHHARTSKEMGTAPLKRLVRTPYHHMDSSTANQNNSSGYRSNEQIPFDPTQLAMYSTFDKKARHLQHTGKRLKRKARRSHHVDPARLAEAWLSSEWDPAFMSEIALQGLLDRTKADEQDEDAMDMTVINGIRMSKYDIRALKVGHKVTPELHDALTKFNQNFIGANNVFPLKNDAPRILEQFREVPQLVLLITKVSPPPEGIRALRSYNASCRKVR
jgi:hypothetical protein